MNQRDDIDVNSNMLWKFALFCIRKHDRWRSYRRRFENKEKRVEHDLHGENFAAKTSSRIERSAAYIGFIRANQTYERAPSYEFLLRPERSVLKLPLATGKFIGEQWLAESFRCAKPISRQMKWPNESERFRMTISLNGQLSSG